MHHAVHHQARTLSTSRNPRSSSAAAAIAALPKRLPIGARYVIEGRGGADGKFRVSSRYVVLPGGRRINVPLDAVSSRAAVSHPRGTRGTRRAAASQPAPKKIFDRTGTTRQQQH